ncbi:MAG: DUF5667 domain-containing protein [Chloroflexota bacterium]
MSVPMSHEADNNNNSKFNDVLERCIRGIESGQVTIEECVARFPQYPELGDLLHLTTEFTALPRPQMSETFAAQTQQQLQASLRATMRQSRPARSAYRWQPLYRVLAAVLVFGLVIFVTGAGLIRASDSTIPGDTLYGVKRTFEQTQLFFVPAESRPDLLTHIAEARLSEIVTLTQRGQQFSEPFITEMLDGVNVALAAQPNELSRTRLLAEAMSTVQQAQSQGGLTADLASRTLAKLEGTGNITVRNGATGTPGIVAQAPTLSPTPTATPTIVLSIEPSVAPSIAPSATPITPTATEANATYLPTFTPSMTRTIVTKPPTFTPSPTKVASPTRAPSATSNASPTLGQGQAVIITGIPTVIVARPTSPPAVVQGSTPVPAGATTAADGGVPRSNNLPPAAVKQAWKQVTFNNCPPEGQGGDPLLNQTRNRVDEGGFQPTAFDNVAKLPWPKDAESKPHDQWSQGAKDEIGRSEGLPLSIEAYLVKVQENGPEAQNCNADKTWQLWLLGTPGSAGDLNRAIIAQITPRVRPNHAGWTLEKLNALAAAGAKVRIGGWLTFNPEQAGEVGKTRASLWELHPAMQIAVWKNDQWVSLDDYQP